LVDPGLDQPLLEGHEQEQEVQDAPGETYGCEEHQGQEQPQEELLPA
jgi:hypothetical protein